MPQYLGYDGRIQPNLPFGGAGLYEFVLSSGLDNLVCGCHWNVTWTYLQGQTLPVSFEFSPIEYCDEHDRESETIWAEINARHEQLQLSLILAQTLNKIGTLNDLGKHLYCEWKKKDPYSHNWSLEYCPNLSGEAVPPNIYTTDLDPTSCWNRFLLDASVLKGGTVNYDEGASRISNKKRQ